MRFNTLITTLLIAVAAALGNPYIASAQMDVFKALTGEVKEESTEKNDSTETEKATGYDKLLKDAEKAEGFINVYLVKDKVYLEIPESLLTKPMLYSGRVTAISNNKDVIPGQMPTDPLMVKWTKDKTRLYLHKLTTNNVADPESSIYERFQDNNLQPILNSFKIEAWNPDSTAMVIDATKLFITDSEPMSPFLPKSVFDSLFGAQKLSGSFKKDMSSVISISSFPTNFNVEVRGVYTVDKEPFTAIINGSFLLLPDDMMRPRISDERIGYFQNYATFHTTDEMVMPKYGMINRWRIEPKPEDVARHRNGALVEPAKPIVYYIDNAFPKEWYKYIKEGVEDWQEAFEEIGFKNAIIAKPYPNDPDFNPMDARYSCVIYSTSHTANAMGPSWTDPRTGEILQGSVYFYHNVLSLLHSWRFVQTSAADPQARGLNYDIKVLGPMLRYLIAHEIGHTLGLMHNMGASKAYKVKDLRSPAFTNKWGTTPSIMDYARYNYIAQPGDGVTDFLPPRLGIYDKYVIKWGYKPIYTAKTAQDEKATLNKWIAEKAGDARFFYSPQQVLVSYDPYALTEDLGDDAVEASRCGISNLKITTDNLFKWTQQEGKTYEIQKEILNQIAGQFRRYINHCRASIGGAIRNFPVQGNQFAAFTPVPMEKQREVLYFVLDEVRAYPEWIVTDEVRDKLGLTQNDFSDFMISTMSSLMNSSVLARINQSALLETQGKPYTAELYLDDIHNYVWKDNSTGAIPSVDKNMQNTYVNGLVKALEFDASEKDREKTSPQKIESRGYLFNKLIETRDLLKTRMDQGGVNRGHYAGLYYFIESKLK